jgi:Tfp pilus assembly protein PilF/SAM-dependent methyltransferase
MIPADHDPIRTVLVPDFPSISAQAVGHHQAGRLDEAIACYGQMLALKPDLAGAHHNLANALWQQGKLEEAEASYRRALVHQPNLTGALNNLGTVLLEQDRLDEAVACYREALTVAPDYAEALNNLGAALCRQGILDEGEACIRRALVLKPDFAGAHDSLGTVLWERGKPKEAEASMRRAFALAPGFTRALDNLGSMLSEQGRLDEAIALYRRFLQTRPEDADGLNGLACVLAAWGHAAEALETIQRSLRIEETASAKRIFVDIVKQLHWANDNAQLRHVLARALTEPWARPSELARTTAHLIKQSAHIGPCVARAVQAWPLPLSVLELFGPGGTKALADDELLLALLVSAQNTDIELERFLTMARRVLLDEAARDDGADGAGLEFYAALAHQCFINEYVFFRTEEEVRLAGELRDASALALETGTPVSSLRLLAVACYFPLHSLSGAARLMEKAWPQPVSAVLAQQVREPQEEAQLRAAMPSLTPIDDAVSRLVRNQYEESPYPRWVRMPPAEKASTITGYLRQKFPAAILQRGSGGETAEFLSAGCGTGQLPLAIAQGVKARVLAIDLSLASLGYAKRKAHEFGLTAIEFAQADLLELGAVGRSFDVVECSGVLHHLADPFAGWRAVLSLLRPDGFMLVGLYSEAARRGITEARRFIAERGYGVSADDIRRCRQDLLELDRSRELGAAFGDFFGMSSCRDLLFHVQEQQMRLPAIAAFLKNNDLTFLGFETDVATLQSYRRRFPDDLAAASLDHWRAFEDDNPDTFSNMYVFWIQKAA